MTQDATILAALRTGPQTTHDLIALPGMAAEFRRSVSSLRKQGYQIVAERVRRGCWRYTLTGSAPVAPLVPVPVKLAEDGQQWELA